ncbi:hypothetical protein [Litorisediminicola beolgyonensis]|uniref:DUF2730 family protein n=1 Tax=Litorisediminicola beolgyonensis TaxID=1173614 RepID=A0ABW3ZIQ8_9RHOB
MGELFEWLKLTEVIVGLVVLMISSGAGVFLWWDRRSRSYVDSRTIGVESSNARVTERLQKLEENVDKLERDVSSIKDRLDALPTARDFMEVKVAMEGMKSTLQQLSGMTQTLYKAAFIASGGKS